MRLPAIRPANGPPSARALAAAALVPLLLAGCSGDPEGEAGDDASSAGEAATGDPGSHDPGSHDPGSDDIEPADDPAAWVRDAADASLAQRAFEIDSDFRLAILGQDVRLRIEGRVDYDATVGDVSLAVEQGSGDSEALIRADGDNLWVRQTGLGDGRWVEGDASRLTDAESFRPEGLLGVLLVLRAAEDVEVGDTDERGGVPVVEYTTTVAYEAAVEAAGEDEEALASAFSLSGEGTTADLDLEVWIGEDGVVRDFTLDIEHEREDDIDGSYDVRLSGVGESVEPPEAPPAEETLTGPEADALLDRAIT